MSAETEAGQSVTQQLPIISLSTALWAIYFLGVGVFLVRFIIHLVQLRMMRAKYGAKKIDGFNMVFTDSKFSPFSFINTIFIKKDHTSDKDIHEIISHERVHIKQYHSLDLILVELIIIFQWFNPFVWPYKGYLKETHEYLADDGVIAQGCDAAKYQMLVFEQLVGVKLFGFSSNFNQSQIKRRITMMTKTKSNRLAKVKALLFLPVLLFLLLAFATPMVIGEPESDKSDKKEKVAKLDKSEIKAKEKQWVAQKELEDKQKELADQKKKLKQELWSIEAAQKKSQIMAEEGKVEDKKVHEKKMVELANKKKIVKKKLMEISELEEKVALKKKKMQAPAKAVKVKKKKPEDESTL